MKEYMELQMAFIHKYARHFHISDDEAAWQFIGHGLATRFAKLYRRKFGMPEEG